jgi:thiol peroxidase
MEERIGEAFELDERLTVVGGKLHPEDTAPDFCLDSFDPVNANMQRVRLEDSSGTVRILNVVNSLDTPVCHIETRYWEKARGELPSNVSVYTVSMDLPFAQARWRTAEGVNHQVLSSHRSEQFGRDYGVLLKEWRLLQRAVFVIDAGGQVVHAEYLADQMQEPDYTAAIEAARRVASE